MQKYGFGLMRLPLTNGEDQTSIDIEQVKIMADDFMKQGFTYYDTASCYHNGSSEIAFREAVAKRYPRDSYTITDKLSLFMLKSADEMQSFFDGQLERMGVDYVDYYLIHALGNQAYKQAQEWGAFEFCAKLKAEGKVKHVGFSFHDKADVLDRILTDHPEVELVQLQINYLDWEDENVQSRACYEVAVKHGKPIVVMEPVKGGALANVPESAEKLFRDYAPDMSPASWAIRFAASPESVFMVLSGVSNTQQMTDNLSFMKNFNCLNKDELAIIDKASKIIKSDIEISCTSCRYCVEDCPMNIPIPDYFSVYNNLKRFGSGQRLVSETYYENLTEKYGKASACIKCGKCEELCPQLLQIRQYLEAVAAVFE